MNTDYTLSVYTMLGRSQASRKAGSTKRAAIQVLAASRLMKWGIAAAQCKDCNTRLDRLATPQILRLSADYLEKHSTRKEG